MNLRLLSALFCFSWLIGVVYAYATTDSLQDADPAQSGYLENHNLHPATVGSPVFGRLWKNQYGAKEVWYAKPLVFTPVATEKQLVFLASNMNIIRTLDVVTGILLNSRTVQPPFLSSDLGCGDIPNFVGIIGTPIIDKDLEIVYFFSKGYKNGASSGGVPNGQYSFYAVDINTLQDMAGFPITIDGHYADNDKTRYFIGGTVLQRPSLTQLNGAIVGAFGGHCDLFNYTGLLVGVSKTPGVGVTSMYAMEASPGAPSPQSLNIMTQNGGKAGIWQSGMGIATDGSEIFIATGNGQGHSNGDVPRSGSAPLSTLDEVVAKFQVSATGAFGLKDYFEPYEYVNMDAADKDLGSSGVTLLDSNFFNGTGVSRIAFVGGKNGKAYFLNTDLLGGFKQGAGGTDANLQTLVAGNTIFSGAASYPLEGGYIYFTPVGSPTYCYRIGHDDSGKPLFTLAGQSAASSGNSGPPTVTSYKGQAGTGILWLADVNLGLRAFNAVPINGVLDPISLPAVPGLAKFQRVVFGDGIVFVSDSKGGFYALGSPVALSLQCNQPVNFGSVAIGDTSTVTITCTALIAITRFNGCMTMDSTFQCHNSTLPQSSLAKGATFSFPVSWDLSASAKLPGVASTVIDLFITNGVPLYSTTYPISVMGTVISDVPFLSISPAEVDFGGIIVQSPTEDSGISASITVSNLGNQPLTFVGFAWDDAIKAVVYNNLTKAADGSTIVGNGFTSFDFPQLGDTLLAGDKITISLTFRGSTVGNWASTLTFFSNGGSKHVLLVGSIATAPIANLSISTVDGGWDIAEPAVMSFGNIRAGTTAIKNIRICNSGGSALTITKSKPPIQPELTAVDPTEDLHEGQMVAINSCALGPVEIAADFSGPNLPVRTLSDVWTLNTDGVNTDGTAFGVHEVSISATIVSRQVGPLLPDGSGRYRYLGCFSDIRRQFSIKLSYTAGQQAANENGQCQNDCLAKDYAFAGTEYHTECWCGNAAPTSIMSLTACGFSCPGDKTQACGGDGSFISVYYDSTKFSPPVIPIASSIYSRQVFTSSTSSSQPFFMSKASTKITSRSLPLGSTLLATRKSSSIPTFPSSRFLSTRKPSAVFSSARVTSSTTSGSKFMASKNSSPPSIKSSATSKPISSGIVTISSHIAPPLPLPSGSDLDSFAFIGCWAEPSNGRALTGASFANDTMTRESCATSCNGKYQYWGVEYGRECYCGNTLAVGTLKIAETDCKTHCAGNSAEICGAGKRISLYNSTSLIGPRISHSIGSFIFVGCQTEVSRGPRALTEKFITSTNMTNELCADACSAYSIFGTEYGVECYCGNTISAKSKLVPVSDCSSPCPGNLAEVCGAGLRLIIYSKPSGSSSKGFGGVDGPSATLPTTIALIPRSSVKSAPKNPSPTDLPETKLQSPITSLPKPSALTKVSSSSCSIMTQQSVARWSSVGCFYDTPHQHNLQRIIASDDMSVDLCIQAAEARLSASPATTFDRIGLEYGRECWGATASFSPAPTSLVGGKACTMTCMGMPKEKCGDSHQYNLYYKGNGPAFVGSIPTSTAT